jgi:hypothetical protein
MTGSMPVTIGSDPDTTGSGTITATDAVVAAPAGTGAFVSGASTAGSVVSLLAPGGDSAWMVQITGQTTGSIWFEGSLDSTTGTDGNWQSLNGRQSGVINTILASSATAGGLWRGNASGLKYFRVRQTGTLTGTPAIVIRLASGSGAVFLNASIPAGSNSIGSVSLGGSGGMTAVAGSISAAVANAPGSAVTASTTAQIVAATATAGNATFHLVTSAFVGTLIFEASVDAGLNYSPIIAIREDGSGAESTTAISTAAAFIRQYTVALPGLAYFRVRCSAFTSGTVAVVIQPGPFLIEPNPALSASAANIGGLYPTPTLTVGTATGTTAATAGQVGRVVRANANVAQATAATLIAAPAAGTRIYVTGITCANEGATLTVLRLFAGTLPAAAGAVAVINDCFDFPMAPSGGGAAVNFPPSGPWALPAATALSFAVTVATTWDVSVAYYVAA